MAAPCASGPAAAPLLYRRENRPQPTMSDWVSLSLQGGDEPLAPGETGLYDSERYLDILRSRARIISIVKEELTAIGDEFGTPRRTRIIEADAEMEAEAEMQRDEDKEDKTKDPSRDLKNPSD